MDSQTNGNTIASTRLLSTVLPCAIAVLFFKVMCNLLLAESGYYYTLQLLGLLVFEELHITVML